jgi:hypothetical protein
LHGRVAFADRAVATDDDHLTDLLEVFLLLARVKRSLCADIDHRLGRDHGISLETLNALAVVSEAGGVCDEHALAVRVLTTPADVDDLLAPLLASGYVTRSVAVRSPGREIKLTLRGAVVLKRAGRTLDLELRRRLGGSLSSGELAQLEVVLAALRLGPAGPGHTEPRPSRLSA